MWTHALFLLLFLSTAVKGGCPPSYATSLAYFWDVDCNIFGVELMYDVSRVLRFLAPFCTTSSVISAREREAHVVLYKDFNVFPINLCLLPPCDFIQTAVSLVYRYWNWMIFSVSFILLLVFCVHFCLLYSVTASSSTQLAFLSVEAMCCLCSFATAFLLFFCS